MLDFPSCCIDCRPPKRNGYCHSYCKEYLEAKEAHAKKRELLCRHKKAEIEATKYASESSYRRAKRKEHDHRRR